MSLRDQLQTIYDQRGQLTPRIVVDVARDPTHPLHSRFEWDDTVAGEAWRRKQAHDLIRSVRVVFRPSSSSDVYESVRAFHAIRSPLGSVFEPVERIVNDEFMSRVVLAEMERDWQNLKRRYETFEEFWALVLADSEASQ